MITVIREEEEGVQMWFHVVFFLFVFFFYPSSSCQRRVALFDSGPSLSRLVTKSTKWHVRSAKTQISLGIRPVWSEFLLCTQWVAKDPSFLHAESEDSDQTGRMPRLIWVFAGHTCHLVGFVMMRLIFIFSCIFYCVWSESLVLWPSWDERVGYFAFHTFVRYLYTL